MLDDLERLGLSLDPGSQLVVLCEVCGRPSNKTCFACGIKFCDFCTRSCTGAAASACTTR